MKRISPFWSVVGLPLLLSTTAWSQETTAAAEKAVTALENQWVVAQRTNNAELVAPLLADNFVQTSGDGKVTVSKAAALATAKAEKFASMEYIGMKVYVFGNTAVAIALGTSPPSAAGACRNSKIQGLIMLFLTCSRISQAAAICWSHAQSRAR